MAYSFQKIDSVIQDIAGKWRALVSIGEETTVMFKFHREPTTQEIINETDKYLVTVEQMRIEEEKKKVIEEQVSIFRDSLIKAEKEK